MPKLRCTGCGGFTHHRNYKCIECGYVIEYMTVNRQVEPSPDPVLTFEIMSVDYYPDNDTEVILKWLADGKYYVPGSGSMIAAVAFEMRVTITVPTDKTKHMEKEQLHAYISDRPFLYDKNATNEPI